MKTSFARITTWPACRCACVFGGKGAFLNINPAAIGWIIVSYALGAVPTSYLLTKWLQGADIRALGSGNPGATNVFRSVGKGAGVVTLLVDIFKGWLPVWLSLKFFPGHTAAVLTGLAAVVGHTWSPFLRWAGGKGVATAAGVFIALLPVPTLIALGVFGAGFGVSKHVSVGSIAAAATLPVACIWTDGIEIRSCLALVIAVLVIIKHIPNMRRLVRGKELSLTHEEGPS